MPPKEEAPKKTDDTPSWDKNSTFNRITSENEKRRQNAMETSRHVAVRYVQDPHRKLRERLNTYHNIRRMKTEYKNYVKKFGTPAFEVPNFNSMTT